MNSYYVYVECIECGNRSAYGLTHNPDDKGNTVEDHYCEICLKKVDAKIVELKLAPSVEENPIKGSWGQ